MIPSPWVAAILLLATHRLVRFVGWDHLPPLPRVRAWVSGEHAVNSGSSNTRMGLTSERLDVRVAHRRPWFDELFGCAFCMSVWVGTAVYLAWVFEPRIALYALAVPALSSATGFLAKWLDP